MTIKRLGIGDITEAIEMFQLVAHVFDEPSETLSAEYARKLMSEPRFWALTASEGTEIVGGITG